MFLKKILQRQTDDDGGEAGNNDFEPKTDGVAIDVITSRFAAAGTVVFLEGPDAVEIEHDHGQNGAELNYNEEKIEEILADVHLKKFVD